MEDSENIHDLVRKSYTTLSVGAIENKLDSLKEALLPYFDSEPEFEEKRSGYQDTIEHYILKGSVDGTKLPDPPDRP